MSDISRRTFVKIGTAAGAGLTLGIAQNAILPGDVPTDAAFAPNPFLRIDTDGSITVIVDRAEMGQGVATALPQLLAEELDAPWEQVSFEFAPAHSAYGMFGMQVTGGSTSVVQSWEPLREAGATAAAKARAAGEEKGREADGEGRGKGCRYSGAGRQTEAGALRHWALASLLVRGRRGSS